MVEHQRLWNEASPGARVAGRPRHYDVHQLMEVWLYVRVGMIRTRLSALKFCQKASFCWTTGGDLLPPEKASRETGRVIVDHMADGETLRRRYQEAAAFIRTESEPYRRLWEQGVRSTRFGSVSPMEEWWQSELKAELRQGCQLC